MTMTHAKANSMYAVQSQMDKKKLVLAAGLIVVMAFMWVRVFTAKKETPLSSVDAFIAENALNQNSSSQGLKVEYTSLPFVMGRNDELEKDFFDVGNLSSLKGGRGFSGFENTNSNEIYGSATVLSKSDLADAAKNIKLQAVLAGDDPEAFIENEIYKLGQFFVLEYKGRAYKLKISSIESGSVKLNHEGVEIEINIVEAHEAKKE